MRKKHVFHKVSHDHLLHMQASTKSYGTQLSRSAGRDDFSALKPSNKTFWKAVSSLTRGSSRIPTLSMKLARRLQLQLLKLLC